MLPVLPHLITTLAGLIIPPAFHVLKQKICPNADTPTAVLGTLATTKPEAMSNYIDSLSKLLHAQVAYYNRDVVGEVSLWVRNLRASIRPFYIIFGVCYFLIVTLFSVKGDQAIIFSIEATTSTWFGCQAIKFLKPG
jgi:hypothetical protein